jgi:hypothetical protein
MQEEDEYLRIIKKAYIEITNVCNLSCPFCPGTTRTKAFMQPSEFEIILERLQGRVQCLYFHVMGEPLLHPALGEFLDQAYEAGLPVNLTTNGTLLGSVGDMLITKPALRQVNISLHSHSNSSEDSKYLDEVLAFTAKARRFSKTLVGFRLWNEQGEGGANPENEWILERLMQAFGLDRSALDAVWGRRGKPLAEGVYLNRSSLFEWPDIGRAETGTKGFCMGLRDQIGILCDGTVVPCCLDSEGIIALGNLISQPLEDILAMLRAQAIYEGFSRRKATEELCRKCGYRMKFD